MSAPEQRGRRFAADVAKGIRAASGRWVATRAFSTRQERKPMFDSEWLAREIAEANQRISDVCRASESARTERNERARRTAIDALTDRVLGDKDLTRAIVAEYVGRELKFI